MDFALKFIIGGIIIISIAIFISIEKKNEQITTNKSTNYNKAKQKLESIERKKYNPVSNWIFITPIIIFIVTYIIKNAYSENIPINNTTQLQQINENPKIQNNKIINRGPTQEEEKAYMQEHNLIKLGSEYHWCGIKESDEIKPITKALDMGCQNDFCKIEKYFDYVKNIPYEKGTPNKDKNAVEVMKQWKGDCDERSDLLASMMIANNYQIILIYTKDHTFAAVNIPNYQTEEKKSYFEYRGQKYYWAETTDPNAVIGSYNRIEAKEIRFAYNANEKKEIPINEIHGNVFL